MTATPTFAAMASVADLVSDDQLAELAAACQAVPLVLTIQRIADAERTVLVAPHIRDAIHAYIMATQPPVICRLTQEVIRLRRENAALKAGEVEPC